MEILDPENSGKIHILSLKMWSFRLQIYIKDSL